MKTSLVNEIGRVGPVGDGIASVCGSNEIHAGEMVEFSISLKGIAMTVENESLGIGVFFIFLLIILFIFLFVILKMAI